MVAARKLKEAEITEQDSLLLTRNLLRIAIFNISYIRGLFPEKYFNDKSVPALEMKIKKLMPMDAESRRLIDWMEKGVYDALQKKYLKTLLFCICEEIGGPMLEEYAFSFSYSNSESQEVSMNINRTGTKNKGAVFKSDSAEVTPNQMRSSACKMIRTLVQLMRTLDQMPEERVILMKLLYYDDVTPADYEPPFFRGCSAEEAHNSWTKKPLKMDVGNVNSKHFLLALRVKSILDSCEDENDDIQDDDVSLGADSTVQPDSSDSDSEVNHSPGDQYIVAPVGKQPSDGDDVMVDEDNTQDPVEDEQQLKRVRDWIGTHHMETVELTDILSNFPDISVQALIEEILDKLVGQGLLSRGARDIYSINNKKQKNLGSSVPAVKEETDVERSPVGGQSLRKKEDDYLYMKALYHALPMDYVTIAKLQTKLGREANQTTVRKLIDKMALDGYVVGTSTRRLGKRVIHSELTDRKLSEVKKNIDQTSSPMDISKQQSNKINGTNYKDTSTCAGLHSFGSEMTRTREKSDTAKNGMTRGDREQGNTPISRAEPVTSRESIVPRNDHRSTNGNNTHFNEGETTTCDRYSQDKRSRKASSVKEPLLQYSKRQKSQAA
ncbi:hypothetical protein Sjap_023297 [Stephania japonica]|uniref:HORMA domain-containing protein n=1 Tax=Stephania japonica TaxID=461633 RepID=A0AAP0HP45_9MAGN